MFIYATDNGHLFEKEDSFLRRDSFLNDEIYMGSLKVGQESSKLYLEQEIDRLFRLINNQRIEKGFVAFDYKSVLEDILSSIVLDVKNKNFSPVISRILLIVTETPLEIANIPKDEVLRVATKLNLFYLPVGKEKRILDEYMALTYNEEEKEMTFSENKPLLYYNLPAITDPYFLETIDEQDFKQNLEKEKMEQKDRLLSQKIDEHLKELTLGRSNNYFVYLSDALAEDEKKELLQKGVHIVDLPYSFTYVNERLRFLLERRTLLYLKEDPEAPKGYSSYRTDLSKYSMEYLIVDPYMRLHLEDLLRWNLKLLPMDPTSRKPLKKEVVDYYHDYYEKVLTGKLLDYYNKYCQFQGESEQLQKVMDYQVSLLLFSEFGTSRSRFFHSQKLSITDLDEFYEKKSFQKAVCLSELEEKKIYRYNRKLLRELDELRNKNLTLEYKKKVQERILHLLLEEIEFDKSIHAIFIYDSLDPKYRRHCQLKNITSFKTYVEEIPVTLSYRLDRIEGNEQLLSFVEHLDEFYDDCEQSGVDPVLIQQVKEKKPSDSSLIHVRIQKSGHIHNFYERDERYLDFESPLLLKKSFDVKDIKKYLDMDLQVESFRRDFIEKAVYDHRFFYRFLYEDYKNYQKSRSFEVPRLMFIEERYERKKNRLLLDLLQKTYLHMIEQQITNGSYEIRPLEALKGYVDEEYVNVGLQKIEHLLHRYQSYREEEKERLSDLEDRRENKRKMLNDAIEEYTGSDELKFLKDQTVSRYKQSILSYFKNGFQKFKESNLSKNRLESTDPQRYELLYELGNLNLSSQVVYTLSVPKMEKVLTHMKEDFPSVFQKEKRDLDEQVVYVFHRFLQLMNQIFDHLQTNISDYSSYEICLKNIDTAEDLYTKILLRYQEIKKNNYDSDNLFYYVEIMNEINDLLEIYEVDQKTESEGI